MWIKSCGMFHFWPGICFFVFNGVCYDLLPGFKISSTLLPLLTHDDNFGRGRRAGGAVGNIGVGFCQESVLLRSAVPRLQATPGQGLDGDGPTGATAMREGTDQITVAIVWQCR